MATATKSATKKSSAKKSAKKSPAPKEKKASTQTSRCWPGFEPTPGSTPGEKGSCKPKAGKKSPGMKKADQKAAAASKLRKSGH